MKTAVYPGSFDPITLGHLNIIRRAAAIFDKVVVCVMVNAEKNPLFTRQERVELISKVVERFSNVSVMSSDKLLVDVADEIGDCVIVKGLRAISDFEKEFQMALINKKLNAKVETLFLTSSEKYTFLSSSVVREIASYGAPLEEFVPREIIGDIRKKMESRR